MTGLLDLRHVPDVARDQEGVETAPADALAHVREAWEPETTARNVRLIASARRSRGENPADVDSLVAALLR